MDFLSRRFPLERMPDSFTPVFAFLISRLLKSRLFLIVTVIGFLISICYWSIAFFGFEKPDKVGWDAEMGQVALAMILGFPWLIATGLYTDRDAMRDIKKPCGELDLMILAGATSRTICIGVLVAYSLTGLLWMLIALPGALALCALCRLPYMEAINVAFATVCVFPACALAGVNGQMAARRRFFVSSMNFFVEFPLAFLLFSFAFRFVRMGETAFMLCLPLVGAVLLLCSGAICHGILETGRMRLVPLKLCILLECVALPALCLLCDREEVAPFAIGVCGLSVLGATLHGLCAPGRFGGAIKLGGRLGVLDALMRESAASLMGWSGLCMICVCVWALVNGGMKAGSGSVSAITLSIEAFSLLLFWSVSRGFAFWTRLAACMSGLLAPLIGFIALKILGFDIAAALVFPALGVETLDRCGAWGGLAGFAMAFWALAVAWAVESHRRAGLKFSGAGLL